MERGNAQIDVLPSQRRKIFIETVARYLMVRNFEVVQVLGV